jgi:EAL domain-containing protein (putative c-di-GMP-specific phosphodiesterase class I)/GGDEF domain-containing protein
MSGQFRDRAQHIHRLALRDAETGLPNRLGVEQLLIEEIARKRGVLVVAALGLQDGASALDAAGGLSGGRSIIGRLGADSLALAFVAAEAGAAQAGLAEILARQTGRFSAGLAVASATANEPYALLEAAEHALALAKSRGAPVVLVDAAGRRDETEEAALLADLSASLLVGEISLLHQPKVRLADGAVAGVECLARWTHPRRGVVSPDVFVPVAEARGQIAVLTEWTLGRAIADQQALASAGFDLPFSVNVSAALLADRAFAARAIHAVRAAGARLCFEITETAIMAEPEVAREIVAAFTAAQIEISIDDYGARLSSLSYLMEIPAHELKIDKKFIGALETSAYDRALVSSMIELAHDLGLKVTAEGVESDGALGQLRRMKCDMAQGNLIAQPLSLGLLQDYLARA